MNANPLVTIAIPTYNRARAFLPQALHCAVAQTYKNIEIFVSDNCSEDETESVVKSLGDNRIRYHKQPENVGYLRNANFCLEQARGEYFLLLFDDDLIDQDFVECCMNAACGCDNIGLILTGIRVIDGDGVIRSQMHNGGSGDSVADFCLRWFESKFPLYLCSTVFLTKGLRDIGGIRSEAYSYSDVIAEVKMAAKFNRVDVFDVKASFRHHDNNMGATTMKVSDWVEDSIALLELMSSLSHDKKGDVQASGLKYFCNRNYQRAGRIPSLIHRLYMYVTISRRFQHASSLPIFLYRTGRNCLTRWVKKPFSLIWHAVESKE